MGTCGCALGGRSQQHKGRVEYRCWPAKWDTPLSEALFGNHIDADTLDAMMSAARDAFPQFRRYLQAKARLIGTDALAWFDIFAPVGSNERTWEYSDATTFIVEQFGTYSSRLSEFAGRAFRENWIDAEPREGKRDGAFCMKLRKDESRIMANFVPAYDGMSTLAHELGHAYHNLYLAHRPVLLRTAPMTLAETASIFCQTLIKEAVLQNADSAEQLTILEASLQDQNQVVVDISSRFLFEQRVYEQRRRTRTIDRRTQRIDDGIATRYLWRRPGSKAAASIYVGGEGPLLQRVLSLLQLSLHVRIALRTWPICSVSSRSRRIPSRIRRVAFVDRYRGCSHASLRLWFRFAGQKFWDDSLDIVRKDVDRFEKLVEALRRSPG